MNRKITVKADPKAIAARRYDLAPIRQRTLADENARLAGLKDAQVWRQEHVNQGHKVAGLSSSA
jgi:hypothetical protein